MTMASERRLGLVTGASSGIGRSLASGLARRDFDLIVVADEHEITAAQSDLLAEHGGEVLAVEADLATSAGVAEVVRCVEGAGRPLDAMLLNAGVGVNGRFVETVLSEHLRLVGLNVTGAVELCGRLLPAMVERGAGHVMFTSSIAATMPGPFMATYNASKAFLLSFAEALRVEVADAGVTVTALMPGPTDTEFFRRAGMEDTKLGQGKKDSPDEVAEDGIEAMLAGKDKVVAGSLKNKVQAAVGEVTPESVAARAHAPLSDPDRG